MVSPRTPGIVAGSPIPTSMPELLRCKLAPGSVSRPSPRVPPTLALNLSGGERFVIRGSLNRESTDRHDQGEGTPGRSGLASISPCPHTGSRDQSTDRDAVSPG